MLTYPVKARTFDSMGDEFKAIEKNFTLAKVMPDIPVIARLDIRAGHSFCAGLEKPYSQGFIDCMKQTCIALGKEFQPSLIFVQSDEISLVWLNGTTMFNGTTQKLVSTIAAYASVVFNKAVMKYLPSHVDKTPTFDCRIFQVSTRQKAFENIVWRQKDAAKNSVSMIASCYYTVEQLNKKNTYDKIGMIKDAGVDFDVIRDNQYVNRGSFFKQCTVLKEVVIDERFDIEYKFVTRNVWGEVTVPMLSAIVDGDSLSKELIEVVFSQNTINKT